ncbi:uncharacterized protein CC84DRAFT_1161575 [Paraphaeosphaeria sporulosa]|uniref:Uncharacterized protein n=1 Tax=Paraphaeosphaeria sporulosa TaxID=1460663 RepID=A0A177CTX9_9PLEO|nr:uncharacterized protein CC84DRAFT_1161575 [Paraphaeosphaeria sporulosa]OAG10706.1 hypothetical protein CC84DRAFT_1161575 [Paraphaeosphaeria sporulosa]
MSQQPGGVVGKMLWLVPRYVEEHGTLMRLGAILTDPTDLESACNLDRIPVIPPKARRNATPHVRNYVHTQLSNRNSVLAKAVPELPYFQAGLSADATWKHDADTTLEAMDIKAEVFIPDKDFMREALSCDAVIAEMRKCFFKKSFYMIVGVATARNLTLNEKLGSERRIAASAHAQATGVAGAGELGFERERTATAEGNLAVTQECDFAFRLREFVYSNISGVRDKGNYGESAMFGEGKSGKTAQQEDVEEFPEFLFFMDEDEDASDVLSLPIEDNGPNSL